MCVFFHPLIHGGMYYMMCNMLTTKVLIISMTMSLSMMLSIECWHKKYKILYKLLLLQLSISSDVCSGNLKFGMSSKGRSLFIRFRSLMRSTWKNRQEKNNNKSVRQKFFMAICQGHSHINTQWLINIQLKFGNYKQWMKMRLY